MRLRLKHWFVGVDIVDGTKARASHASLPVFVVADQCEFTTFQPEIIAFTPVPFLLIPTLQHTRSP